MTRQARSLPDLAFLFVSTMYGYLVTRLCSSPWDLPCMVFTLRGALVRGTS